MPIRLRDRISGSVLLAVALVWIVLVYQTIEPAQGPEVGPRAFPLFFGIVLAGLSVLVLLQGFGPAPQVRDEATDTAVAGEFSIVLTTIGSLVVYGMLLEPLGFIPATALVVIAVMVLVLRLRSPLQVFAMALGLSLGSYIVFGKLLGTYLPPGTIFPIYF